MTETSNFPLSIPAIERKHFPRNFIRNAVCEFRFPVLFELEGQKHITDQSLTTFEEKLPPQFFRIQKSFIINKDKIKEMHRHFNSRYLFIMDDKAANRLTSGRTYHDAIRAEFGL